MQPAIHRFRQPRGTVSLKFPRIYPRQLALAVMFLMMARTIYFFPGMSLPSEGWNALSFMFLCFIYFGWKAKQGERFLGFEVYILLMMVVIPLWGGFMADYRFGQPLLYGILVQRTMILGTGGLALLTFYRMGWINTNDCKNALLMLAWLTLFVYSVYMVITRNKTETDSTGAQIRLVYSFIEIGFLYYGLIGFNKKSKFHYFLASLFLVYILMSQKRAVLLTMLGSYGLFVLIRGSFSRLAVFVPAALVGIVSLAGLLYVANPQGMTNLAERVADAVTVVTTGQQTGDVSADVRLTEMAIALPYIENAWATGNGAFSHRYQGGGAAILGGYFFAGDIGIFGVVFGFGVLGTLLFALQFWWVWRYGRAALQGRSTPPMVDAVVAYLIAYGVESLEGGTFAFRWFIGVFLIAYLFMAADERRGGTSRRGRRRRYPSGDLQGLQRET